MNTDIDLGLAISAHSLKIGQTRSLGELASFCQCSKSAIQLIENKAIHKLKKALFSRNDPVIAELCESLFR